VTSPPVTSPPVTSPPVTSPPAASTGGLAGWRAKIRVARASVSVAWSASPFLIAALSVLCLAGGLTSPAIAWLQRDVLDALVTPGGAGRDLTGLGRHHLLILALLLGVTGLLASLLPQWQQYTQAALRRAVAVVVYDRAYAAAASWPGIARFESPAFADKLQLTSQLAQGTASSLITSALGSGQALITAVSFLGSPRRPRESRPWPSRPASRTPGGWRSCRSRTPTAAGASCRSARFSVTRWRPRKYGCSGSAGSCAAGCWGSWP
jgi:hypothetical protein